jgi:hypothetical protein
MPPDPDDATARLSAALVRAVAKRDAGEQADVNTATEVEELKKQAELRGLNQDIAERKKYATYFFILLHLAVPRGNPSSPTGIWGGALPSR